MNSNDIITVLDHGLVHLIDHMGNDAAIVQAARVSYGDGTKTPSDDRTLIRYLMRHHHTTPFEMVEFKFHVKMPIFIARQWQRHRTASINEVSARYTVVKDEFYSPRGNQLRGQDTVNKQGSKGIIPEPFYVSGLIQGLGEGAFDAYENLIEVQKVSREQARMVLPQSAYTEFYWKINLHNLLHFLHLRMDSHAQQEIREYAFALYTLIEPIVPTTLDAFRDYVKDAVTFSVPEQKLLSRMRRIINDPASIPHDLSPGEFREFILKLEALDGR